MKFSKASEVEQVCYEFKLADYPRAQNRARINDLFNGVPPYDHDEVEENNIAINVNFLEGCRIAHEGRMQLAGNFLKPGRYFNCITDAGPKHKRRARSAVATNELAKVMKRSSIYFETFRSKFASLVLHGIGTSGWENDDFWCPDAIGIEDALVPANTLLTMKNLPFFAVYRSYTGPELARLTRDRDTAKKSGWNLSLVEKCLEYIDQEATRLMGTNWPEVWSPEKMAERVKGDGGFYAGDQVPTIDCFDFYFWDDDQKTEGWKRRIILDSWSTPSGVGGPMGWNSKVDFAKNQFLFNSGSRKVASSWHELIAWQFADCSAVAPFRYHSVRGLGFLLYAVLNLQNRLRCKFNESIFEALMMYFRVRTMDDAERALKVELLNRGFVDETVQFIPAAERYQVPWQLVQMGLQDFKQITNEQASSYTPNREMSQDKKEKTRFQVMAELQAMNTMISSAFQQAYKYQEFQDREIFRRFCLKDSRDPDVNTFQARCLSQDVPRYMLSPECWEIQAERVLGAGNKTMEMTIAEAMMQFRNLYDPEPQRAILRDFTLAITDDPGRTEALVPEEPTRITDSVHDAQLAAGTLMLGLPVAIKTGMNHIEYVDTLLISLQVAIGRIQKRGGVPTPEELEGLDALMQHIAQHIQIVEQDPNEKNRVKQWGDQMKRLGNFVKAFGQRLQEMQRKAAQSNGGGGEKAAETQAKIQAMLIQAQAKAQNTRESHAQRTAQREVQFQMEQKREDQKLAHDLQREQLKHHREVGAQQVEHLQQLTHAEDEHAQELIHSEDEHAQELEQAKREARMKSVEE